MPFRSEKEKTDMDANKTENVEIRPANTKRTLNIALSSLLKRQNFRKVTVKEICREASVSRVTFYVHYADKYDLLRDYLANLTITNLDISDGYDKIEQTINNFFKVSKMLVKNIMEDSDSETQGILLDFMLGMLQIYEKRRDSRRKDFEYIVSTVFYSGGLTYYVLQHLKNNFQMEILNVHIYDIVKKMKDRELQ